MAIPHFFLFPAPDNHYSTFSLFSYFRKTLFHLI